jgi:hypothetical protein
MSLRHADETGMHFHDAEVMRLRARTLRQTQSRRAALDDARDLANAQGATLFELRCLLDVFALTGRGDRVALADVLARFRGDARWREHVRAQELLA